MNVELGEITLGDADLRAGLLKHVLAPEQQDFAATAAESLPAGDIDPDRLSVAILVGGVPVGMFALDRGGYFREFDDDPYAVLLRAFYITGNYQGHGYGTQTVSAIRVFVQQRLPDVKRVVLTVNHRNTAAIVTYLSGGFVQTGHDYLGGPFGPQYVMVLGV